MSDTVGNYDHEQETYMGVSVETIAIMYDYLRNYDGALDTEDGFAEGFVAGAKYAVMKVREGLQASFERSLVADQPDKFVIGLAGIQAFE